jgi:CubicO group peptidase (beta-lactamase class C family)
MSSLVRVAKHLRRLAAPLVITSMLLSVAQVVAASGTVTPTKLDEIFSKWNKWDSPGCALGIYQDSTTPLFRAYGSADLEHRVPIEPDTVFEAGSVSKQFTAASTLILVEQGKLSLDDDVRKFIPELPDYGTRITVADLLGHTSGLRDWEGVVDIAGWPVTTRVYTVKDVLEIAARQQHLNFKPGSEFSYTNTGYILLVVIIERVTGEPFANFSSEHLFAPLMMTQTQWRDDFRRVVNKRAIAYQTNVDSYRQLMPFESVIGAGGLLTTVGDLLKWNKALDMGALGKFVTSELQRSSSLRNGHATSYARGLELADYHGVRKIFHTGETGGYEAYLARYPDQHLSIAVLCNGGNEVGIDSIGDKVAELLLPAATNAEVAKPPAKGIGLTPKDLIPLAGDYFDGRMASKMQLEMTNGQLARVSDGMLLTPIAPGEFRTNISTIKFVDHDHFVREFDDGRRWEFSRINLWQPTEKAQAEFTGQYRSDEAQAAYNVDVVNGHLRLALDDRRWDFTDLVPVSTDTFSKPHHAYRFIRDSHGQVTALDISDGWEHVYGITFKRVAKSSESGSQHYYEVVFLYFDSVVHPCCFSGVECHAVLESAVSYVCD